MRIADVNVLLYAQDSAAAQHERARAWLEDALSGEEPTGFTWQTLVAFLRISTSSSIYAQPLHSVEVLDLIDAWLDHPGSAVVGPGPEHQRLLREIIGATGTAGNLTSDAHLAAVAIESGAMLASFDADFHRFKHLRFEYLG